MDKEYIGHLLQLYFREEATAEQRDFLFTELSKPGQEQEWEELMLRLSAGVEADKAYNPVQWQPVIQGILKPQAKLLAMRRGRLIRWSAAAAVILILGLGSYFIFSQKGQQAPIAEKAAPRKNDIAPGYDGAILTLSDGRQIVLDSMQGTIATEGGVAIVNEDGSVSYSEATDKGAPLNVVYNTITTPRGRQYQLILADGSKVWLNAASSIRFPSAFTGDNRVVEVTGEAYFEVTHDVAKPFIVSVNDMQVEVLGTHFNINSYGDEGVIKTTLLEGKVRVTRNGAIAILKPGQQAIVSLGVDYPPPVINRSPDLDKTMAWKDNRFYFEDDDIISIMAQLERWYDIRVVYDDQVSNQYTGIISRNVPISKVLELFEKIGDIRFTVEGHTVHVKAVK